MLKRTLTRVLGLLPLMIPAVASATITEPEKYDARIANYFQGDNLINVTLDETSTTIPLLILILLIVVGVSVMFKNAQRTHLD